MMICFIGMVCWTAAALLWSQASCATQSIQPDTSASVAVQSPRCSPLSFRNWCASYGQQQVPVGFLNGSGGKQPAVALALPFLVCGIFGSYVLLSSCLQNPCLTPLGVRTQFSPMFLKVFIWYDETIILIGSNYFIINTPRKSKDTWSANSNCYAVIYTTLPQIMELCLHSVTIKSVAFMI